MKRPVFVSSLTLAAALLGGALGARAGARTPATDASFGPVSVDSTERVRAAPVRRRVAESVDLQTKRPPSLAEGDTSDGLRRSDAQVLGAPAGLPLEVCLVDGDTGAALTGAFVGIAEGDTEREADDAAFLIPTVPDGRVYRAAAISAGHGDSVRALIEIEPPPGYVFGGDGSRSRSGMRVSPFARSLRATVPLRRPVDVHVDVRSTRGYRIHRKLTSMSVLVGSLFFDVRWAPLRPPYRVTVPYLRGEAIHAGVCTAESSGSDEIVLDEYAPRVDLAIRVPPKCRDPSSAGRPPGGSVPYCRRPDPTWEGSATIFVQVRLADGRCASGARVSVKRLGAGGIRASKRLGADGLAHFDRAPPGTYTVRVHETGMVLTTATVEVVDDGRHHVRLVEPVGETAEITVVNHRGVRLPFARVQVNDCGLEAGAVQRLDHFTDANGVCRIARMSHQSTEVEVRWAGREADATWRPGKPLKVVIPR